MFDIVSCMGWTPNQRVVIPRYGKSWQMGAQTSRSAVQSRDNETEQIMKFSESLGHYEDILPMGLTESVVRSTAPTRRTCNDLMWFDIRYPFTCSALNLRLSRAETTRSEVWNARHAPMLQKQVLFSWERPSASFSPREAARDTKYSETGKRYPDIFWCQHSRASMDFGTHIIHWNRRGKYIAYVVS